MSFSILQIWSNAVKTSFAVSGALVILSGSTALLPASLAYALPSRLAQAPLQAATKVRVTPNAKFRVELVNQSQVPILFAAVGETSTRSLAKGATTTLTNLALPSSILVRANDPVTNDRFFFQITATPIGNSDALRIVVQNAGESNGNTSVYIDSDGSVYID